MHLEVWGLGRLFCIHFVFFDKNYVLGPEIILVRGCENVAGKLRQKW